MSAGLQPNDQLVIPDQLNIAAYVVDRWIEQGHGARPAWLTWERTFTYSDVQSLVNRAGNLLLDRGVKRGDRVLIASRNTPPVFAAVLGALKIGAIPMATSSMFRSSELTYILANSQPTLALGPSDLLDVLRPLPGVPALVALDDLSSFDGLPDQLEAAPTGKEDPAFIFYTSGTTGNPKGICHAQRYLLGDLIPLSRYYLDMTPEKVMFNPHEVSFSYAFGWTLMIPLLAGASSILMVGRLDPSNVLAHAARFKANILASIPALFQALVAVPDYQKYDLSSVGRVVSAGTALSPTLFHQLRTLFPNATVGEAIGQSECQTYICHWGFRADEIKPGSLGRPLPTYDARILDEDGNELPRGSVGNICIREDHPSLFREYWGLPERFSEVHRHGWYYTGDLGHVDEDGFWWFDGRADDMIKSRGYLVSPDEVERVMSGHPAVLEVSVIGVADQAQGQAIRAYVVCRSGAEADGEAIRAFVREHLAPYKTPKEIVFRDELPKTATGKIRRKALREEVQ